MLPLRNYASISFATFFQERSLDFFEKTKVCGGMDKQGFYRSRTLNIACYLLKVNFIKFMFIYWPQIRHVLQYSYVIDTFPTEQSVILYYMWDLSLKSIHLKNGTSWWPVSFCNFTLLTFYDFAPFLWLCHFFSSLFGRMLKTCLP